MTKTKSQADQGGEKMLTNLKTYTKMHVPFGDYKNEPYEVTRATAHCAECGKRVQLKGPHNGKWVHEIIGAYIGQDRYSILHHDKIQ